MRKYKEFKCLECGKIFYSYGIRKFCGRNCYENNLGGLKNPNWKGDKMLKFCPNCNEEFRAKRLTQTFCSKDCWRTHRSKEMKQGGAAYLNSFITNPSKPQIELYNIVKSKYPNAEMNFASSWFSIDVAIPDQMIAIEYDSSYWHNGREKQDKERQRILESIGWKFIRFLDNVPEEKEIWEKVEILKGI